MIRSLRCVVLAALWSSSCAPTTEDAGVVSVDMDFARGAAGFFAAPFPSDDLVGADGIVDLSAHPGPRDLFLVGPALTFGEGRMRGFGTTAPIVFTFDGGLPSLALPSVDASITADAPVALYDVSVDPPVRKRVRVSFLPDGGPFGAPDMLVVLPVQGLPLEPGHVHAAVVERRLLDREGRPLRASEAVAALARGQDAGLPPAAAATYRQALDALASVSIEPSALAGLAVFTTQDPTAELREFYAHARSLPTPTVEAPFALHAEHDDFCVFRSTIRVPSYQEGTSPFALSGGRFHRDGSGAPAVVDMLETRVFVTVPRAPMPANGFPAVVHIRAGGGGLVPMADRSRHAAAGAPNVEGQGPALVWARAGFAGITIDGPSGGLRNPGGGDEQFLIFNTNNPEALLDNLRQYALETALTTHVLDGLDIPLAGSGCTGVTLPGGQTSVRFDGDTVALFGHSMGASIAPLAAAIEPRFDGVLLSGAGASWIENVIYKRKPVNIQPVLQFQLGVETLDRFDPGIGLLQWIGESADAQVYAEHLVTAPFAGRAPAHVLMFQGVVDRYIMPPIANALSLAGGFDGAGVGLEDGIAELDGLEPLAAVLPWVGREFVPYPVSGNLGGTTAAVVQHLEDGIEDGHEVFFQIEGPQHQALCFLEGLAVGTPAIVAPAPLSTPCP